MKQKKKSGSGQIFEEQVIAVLKGNGWEFSKKVRLGNRLGKESKFEVDILAGIGPRTIAVSCKYQDTPGTAIDKIPYEYMSMLHAMETHAIARGFIVVFGKELEDHYFLTEGLNELANYMRISPSLKIVTLREFQSLINTGEIEKQEQLQGELPI